MWLLFDFFLLNLPDNRHHPFVTFQSYFMLHHQVKHTPSNIQSPFIAIVSVLRAAMCALILFMMCPMFVAAQVNTDRVINIGRNAYYFEDYLMAIQYFNQAIQAKPYLERPYLYRAIAKLNLDDYVGAEADATTVISLNEFIPDAYEVRGVARQNMGNSRDAIGDYDKAISLLPRNRQLLFNKAMAQADINDVAGADSTFTELLNYYPGFEMGYLGRARLRLAQNDTLSALGDINRALEINDKSFNGYAMRADIAMSRGKEHYDEARTDIDRALNLQPKSVGLYVNRAFLKYDAEDFVGAMSDFDYAVSLDPNNKTALFNRGLLEAEVSANDRALVDFNKVLELDPSNLHARYNRAMVLAAKHDYKAAIADAQYVIDAFPDFPTGYYMRSGFYREMGRRAEAARDYDRARSLANKLRPDAKGNVEGTRKDIAAESSPEDDVRRQFATLLKVDDNTDIRDEYNNTEIRGRIQHRNLNVELEPMFDLSFYSSPDALSKDGYYMKEVDDLNTTRQLRNVVYVTNRVPRVTDQAMIDAHFRSVADYDSYLSTHQPRTIDYVGRALELMTLHNYDGALADLNKAVALTPDYALAYLMRAQARYHRLQTAVADDNADMSTRAGLERGEYAAIAEDLDNVIRLSPRNAIAWFNKGDLLAERGDFAEARKCFDIALELKPEFGEAYYNRGYVYLKMGDRARGVADLSKAGELGVAAAYNLIKRISN
jgi:tetratricopeptide (TPR) repeat protein